MSSKKCSSCGGINNNIVKFCTSCGNKMNVDTPPKSTTTSVSVTSSPTTTSKSFLSSPTQPILTAKTVTTTTVTTTSSTRPASTIIKPTTTTTTSTRPASTMIKPTTITTTPKSILKPTPHVPSHTTTTTTSNIPSKSILKPVSTTPAQVVTRPKSHTISSKPTTIPSSSSANGNLSFVKMAAMNRETLDSKARESMNIGQSPIMSPAPIISTPSPSKSTLNIKKTTTTTTTTTTPSPTRPASMSVSMPSSKQSTTPPIIDKTKDIDKLEKQIQLEKEKFQNKEREIAQQRQQQYERDKQAEREKHMTEKQLQTEKEEREKQKQLEREREKQAEIKQQQLDREREKHEHIEREKQKLLDREKQKQLEKEEKERQQLEREKQKQLEREREREKQAEKDEKERLKRLERERHNSSSPISISSPSPTNRKDSNPTPSSPSLPSTLSNSSDSNDHSVESTTESPNTVSGKKKRDKEKSKSRIFSLFSSKKDEEDEDELSISGPIGNSNGNTSSPIPVDSPNSNGISHHHTSSTLSHSSDCGGSDRDSGDFSGSSNGGEGQLRKWAIKRNELHKSEGNLFAPSSPSSSNSSFTPIGSHSPTNSSESLRNNIPNSPSSSFIPSHSPSTSNTSTFQMGTSRISSPNPPPDLPGNLPQAIEQRDRVIEEVIVTEADYIRDLEIMVWLKKEMIIHDNDVKGNTIEEINSLFSNVEQLLLVNKELYKKFCNFDNSFNPIDNSASYIDLIANGFASMAEFLRSYFVYCSNQQKALSTFSALKGKNCTYLAYLLTRRECRSLPFDSFLIKPVQRVCKYPLLIRELIKTTPTDSESYGNLLNAQSKIESIVFSVNEKKREFDSQMKMLDIQNRIIESGDNTTKILSPSRKLIKEGTIMSYGSRTPNGDNSSAFKKKNKEGYFYLFNDLFIYAELKITGSLSMGASTSPIRVKSEIPFEYSVICDSPLDECAFELKNKNQWCMFSLDTIEEKQSLFNEIDNSIQSYQGILHEYQKYVDDRNGTTNGSNRQSVNNSQQPSAATITNGTSTTTNNLSLSSSSIGGGASSSSSSEVLSIEEWKLLVKNKPLPALPSHSTISNSPVGSPSALRIGKALPIPPPPFK